MSATPNQIRDRAYEILKAQGVDPLDAPQAVWSAACETARSDLKVEAARERRIGPRPDHLGGRWMY